jgi:hypothetical protein
MKEITLKVVPVRKRKKETPKIMVGMVTIIIKGAQRDSNWEAMII